jgi:Protein of unknown function (DUF2851)
MNNHTTNYSEKFLYDIWENRKLDNDLRTKDGQYIEVIEPGIRNNDLGGPDFQNARIKIGNITYQGDVEIDKQYNDWRTHGHYFNKKYNKVILHAYFSSDGKYPYVITESGRKVQSIPLLQFVTSGLKELIQKAISKEYESDYTHMPCIETNYTVKRQKKIDYLHELGIIRFKEKSVRYLNRLKEIIYLRNMQLKEPITKYELGENFYNSEFNSEDFNDKKIWYQLIYEGIFESLGYSKNKDTMKKLASLVNFDFIYLLKDKENFVDYMEAVYFSVGGLIPDIPNLPNEETSEYSRKLYELWTEVKDRYDGEFLNPAEWNFFRLRPQNFPTIRIAGGARLLDKLVNKEIVEKIFVIMDKDIKDIYILRKIRDLLMTKGEGFWKEHYVFDQPGGAPIKFFVGSTRSDDIIVNVILPVLLIYFEIFGKKNYAAKVIQLYSSYSQLSENYIVKEVSEVLNLGDAWKESVLHQGMIYLYRNYCSKQKCAECKIGEKIFN